jgi:hypothetical protein
VEGEDERSTDEEVQTAGVAVGEGTLIDHCVLAAGGKWLSVRDAARLSDLFNLQEPNLIAEARWMAQQLGPALEQRAAVGSPRPGRNIRRTTLTTFPMMTASSARIGE